ncbi:MAG: hypothetical protein Q8941_20365 [Bacteroidota bacterium]|nr:hypothetical protein [Bacteroidota bacterium]
MDSIDELSDKLLTVLKNYKGKRLFTVAISGIDASGKGYVSKLLQDELEARGYKVVTIAIDPWQNPISIRLQKENAAENFYNNVYRWPHFFDQLIRPLQQKKSILFKTNLIRTDADKYYPFTYHYERPDILLIEGIFLLQEKYLSYYDWKIWIHCSFETGLKRAVKRNAEGLGEKDLIMYYTTHYYPAQRYHFDKDQPAEKADVIFVND